jgi:hypothetical protein
MLLKDIKSVFEEKKASTLHSTTMCNALNALEERPWCDFNQGKGIEPKKLARLLSGFPVVPKNIRQGEKVIKGYALGDFADAFERYFDPPAQAEKPPSLPLHRYNVDNEGFIPAAIRYSARYGEVPLPLQDGGGLA